MNNVQALTTGAVRASAEEENLDSRESYPYLKWNVLKGKLNILGREKDLFQYPLK